MEYPFKRDGKTFIDVGHDRPIYPVEGETKKHLAGQHDQAKHGYRFGSTPSLSRARQLRKQGNWDDYKRRARSRKPAKGGRSDAEAEWKPSMSRADAEKWVKGSAHTESVYHATMQESANSIANEGFKIGEAEFGRLMGDGVYFAPEKSGADAYGTSIAARYPGRKAKTLEVKINVKKVARFSADDALRGSKAVFDSIGVSGWDEWNKLAGTPGGEKTFNSAAVTKVFTGLGFDAIEMTYGDYFGVPGQFVVFDPKNIVVVAND